MDRETNFTATSVPGIGEESAVITSGMTIKGSVQVVGSLRVDGNIDGNVECGGELVIGGTINGDCSAETIIMKDARVKGNVKSGGAFNMDASAALVGDVTAKIANVDGAVKGDVSVDGQLDLGSSALIIGNTTSATVNVVAGAVIEGTCVARNGSSESAEEQFNSRFEI